MKDNCPCLWRWMPLHFERIVFGYVYSDMQSPYTMLRPITAAIDTPNMLTVYASNASNNQKELWGGNQPGRIPIKRGTTYNFMSQGLSAIYRDERVSARSGRTNCVANWVLTGYRICEAMTVANGKMTVGRVNDEFHLSMCSDAPDHW